MVLSTSSEVGLPGLSDAALCNARGEFFTLYLVFIEHLTESQAEDTAVTRMKNTSAHLEHLF